MRILAFSDLHENEAALEALKALSPQFDHVFICGDVSKNNLFAEAVLGAFPKGFVIPGNWDNEHVNKLLSSNSQWIHERRVEIGNGLNVVGFGYSNITPFGTYGELNEDEILSRLSKLPIDSNTILVLHCPPKGYFDKTPRGDHAGSDSILKVITEKKPLAALFGHIHEHMGMQKLGSTTLVKLPAADGMRACSLSIEDKNINAEFMTL